MGVVPVPRRTVLERGARCVAFLLLSTSGISAEEQGSGGAPRGATGRSYAVRGVVRAVDEDHLTITRSTRKGEQYRFDLDANTSRDGEVVVGEMVSVRYRVGEHGYVATAVAARNRRKAPPQAAANGDRAPQHR